MQDTQTHNTSRRLGWAIALVAIATVGLTLVAAGPAAAWFRVPWPISVDNAAPKKSCNLGKLVPEAAGIFVESGGIVSVGFNRDGGGLVRYQCIDGEWYAVRQATPSDRASSVIAVRTDSVLVSSRRVNVVEIVAYDPITRITRRYKYMRNNGKWERVPRRASTR